MSSSIENYISYFNCQIEKSRIYQVFKVNTFEDKYNKKLKSFNGYLFFPCVGHENINQLQMLIKSCI